jgi:hypothetical protein
MKHQRISVSMCTYNGAQYLREQLDSIASQTRLPDELVVCDDQSNDKTTEIVKTFATNVPFQVRLTINEENLGSTKNCEKAIRLCVGDIIALSDQDDVWHPQKLRCIEKVFSDSPRIGAVFTNAEMVDERLHSLGYRLWQSVGFSRIEQNCVTKGKAIEVLLKHNVVTGATMAFRAKFKHLVLPIPDIWVHDGWIALLIASTADLAIIHKPLIKYRQHSRQQIGAIAKGFSKKLANAKQTNSDTYITGFKQYMAARQRLLARRNATHDEKVISRLEAKIHHMHARASMPNRKLRRLPSILRELSTFHYHRYSNGWKSVAKDLFL